jgi:hypothetical protein
MMTESIQASDVCHAFVFECANSQFIWDKSGVGATFRPWLCVTLGSWHVYKQATIVLWQHGLQRWFAPMFHFLFPNCKLFQGKIRLSKAVTLLSYVRLAYPRFRKSLESAIAALEDKPDGKFVVALSNLKNLKEIMEYMIPVVSAHDVSNVHVS